MNRAWISRGKDWRGRLTVPYRLETRLLSEGDGVPSPSMQKCDSLPHSPEARLVWMGDYGPRLSASEGETVCCVDASGVRSAV